MLTPGTTSISNLNQWWWSTFGMGAGRIRADRHIRAIIGSSASASASLRVEGINVRVRVIRLAAPRGHQLHHCQ